MKQKLIIPIVLFSLFVITCRHEIPFQDTGNGTPPVISDACSPDSTYFVNTILPLISSGCAISGCHDPGKHEEGLVLNNYSGIMKIVRAGSASQSELYKIITTTNQGDIMPPPPHAPFSTAAIASIQKWINQGAQNNQCIGDCDTALFTYSGAVLPLINTYCKGCHNPASLGGGIDLSSYNGIKASAQSGKLTGSIRYLPGYIAMPQGGGKLSDCQIQQIEKWIQAGTPDN